MVSRRLTNRLVLVYAAYALHSCIQALPSFVLANNKHLCPVYSQSALSASSEALATVTGIVDGTGSVGAAIGQVTENTQHFLRKKKQVFAVVSGS